MWGVGVLPLCTSSRVATSSSRAKISTPYATRYGTSIWPSKSEEFFQSEEFSQSEAFFQSESPSQSGSPPDRKFFLLWQSKTPFKLDSAGVEANTSAPVGSTVKPFNLATLYFGVFRFGEIWRPFNLAFLLLYRVFFSLSRRFVLSTCSNAICERIF